VMRYPDGGGLSAQGRAKREAVRMRAAEWFAQKGAGHEDRIPAAGVDQRGVGVASPWEGRWSGGVGLQGVEWVVLSVG
jgi:putative transposase